MPIHKLFQGHREFPIHKREIFYKFKEIKALGGDVRQYVAQLMPKIDAEIGKKGRLWMETIYLFGESKDDAMIPFLNLLLKGSFSSEVIEAVEDALDTLLK